MTGSRTGKAQRHTRPARSKSKAGGDAGLLHYEALSEPLASRALFLQRMGRSLLVVAAITLISLGAGMVGYHHLGPMAWIDAFENAAMILSGMGPLAQMESSAGKLFAGLYALYSGLFLVATAGLIIGPVLHRFLHRLHIADEDEA